jgi:hypothetical protein
MDTPAKKILILAANPKQTSRLRLDEEVRDIKEGLRLSQQRDKFILQQEWAVRPRDVRRAVLDFRPNIIHFSGHGAGTTGLSFEDETGKEKLVTAEALAGLFGQFAKQVECVVLNACYSDEQAAAIAQHIDYVIGMNAAIGDKAALEFAVGFYDALVAYDPRYDTYSRIEFAFNIACNAIQFAGVCGDSIPIMKKKPHLGRVEEQPTNPPLEGSPTNGTISVSQNQVSEHIIAQGQNLSLKEDIAPIEARISPKESTPANQQASQFSPIPVEHNNVGAGNKTISVVGSNQTTKFTPTESRNYDLSYQSRVKSTPPPASFISSLPRKAFFGFGGLGIVAAAIVVLQTVISPQSKELVVNANSIQGTEFTNSEDRTVEIRFKTMGQWLAISDDNTSVAASNRGYLSPNGLPNFSSNPNTPCPRFPLAALVVKGKNNECKATGEQGSFKIRPKETVYFLMNDVSTLYSDNEGSIKVKLSIQ